jgi:hypothetical protein
MTRCTMPPGESWETAWRHCEYYECIGGTTTCKFSVSSLPASSCYRDVGTAKEKAKRASRLLIRDDIRMIRYD